MWSKRLLIGIGTDLGCVHAHVPARPQLRQQPGRGPARAWVPPPRRSTRRTSASGGTGRCSRSTSTISAASPASTSANHSSTVRRRRTTSSCDRLPVTAWISVLASDMLAGSRRHGARRRGGSTRARQNRQSRSTPTLGFSLSLPSFWVGVVLVYFFAIRWGSPPSDWLQPLSRDGVGDWLKQHLPPRHHAWRSVAVQP